MNLNELSWWLICQVEIDHNRKKYPGMKVMPGITLKHWMESKEAIGVVV